MSNVVEFKFSPDERVSLIALDLPGFVSSRMNNAEGRNEYKVSYWMNGDRKDAWVNEYEIAKAKP